ncbi:hypothetical protein L6164_031298 [Bauhinia variegata]|uniref:Uncharacterized protein n=1 Tax=Bauhinia variegata TaxID=167791 RepID=A0ACB9LF28_BAUVA|nr:hypothetical protein L6164_031298 [Bauhinia variegata]
MLRASAALNALRGLSPKPSSLLSIRFLPLASTHFYLHWTTRSKGTAKDSRNFMFSETEKGVYVSKAYASTLSERYVQAHVSKLDIQP